MANKNDKEQQKETPKKEMPTRFSKADLIGYASNFGVKPEVMAGALYGVEDATKAEAKKYIKEFLGRGAK